MAASDTISRNDPVNPEKMACKNFLDNFSRNHKIVHFSTCLESLVNNSNVGMFALFLHNRNTHSIFSEKFTKLLTQKVVNNLNLLAWNVNDASINEGLIKILKEILNSEMLILSILMEESGLFVFTCNDIEPLIVYKDDFNEKNFITDICQVYNIDEVIFSKPDYSAIKLTDLTSFGIEYEVNVETAIKKSFQERIPLLLYVHKRSDYFSQTFWDILSKTDANNIIKKFIFFPVDIFDFDAIAKIKNLSQKYEFLNNLFVHILNQESVILIVKKLEDVITDCLKGNVSQEELLTNLFQIYMSYEEDKEDILYKIETRSVQSTIRKFKSVFRKNSLPFEKVSLKNALENKVFVQPAYLRKILIICLYDGSSVCKNLFSHILDNKKVQGVICSLYHILLWNMKYENLHESLYNLNETYFNNEEVVEKIKNKKAGFFLVEAKDDKAEVISFWDMCNASLQSFDNFLSYWAAKFIDKHDATDLSEVEAANKFLSQSLVREEHNLIFEPLPLQRLITKKCTRKNISKRKMLLLHLQNGKTKTEFLDILPTIYADLRKYFCVVAWDISDTSLTSKLLLANERYFRSDDIRNALKNKISETFIFIPTKNTMAFAGKLINLKYAIDIFNKENFNFGSTKSPFTFQQNMCEQLGDRDYNHFNLEIEEQVKFFLDWVGFAIFGPPTEEEGRYKEDQNEYIREVASQIKTQVQKNSFNPEKIYVACIYISTIPKGEKLQNHICLPVIAVQKCVNSPRRSCRFFIDSNLRVYSTWKNYLSENNLAAGTFIVPQDGSYQIDCFGRVRLECIFDEKLLEQIVSFMDTTSFYGGLGSAAVGAATIFTAIPVAPLVVTGAAVTGVATGVYSLFRGAANLFDRNNHEESMNINNREARAAYLNIAAGVFAFGTAGATASLAYFARNGKDIGKISTSLINLMCGTNIAVSGISLGNSIYDVYYCWRYNNQSPGSLMILQLMSSALFFGHSVYNVQSANTIITEAQAKSLHDYSKNLSNKQRKMLNKLTKETVRMREGNTQQAYRDVISYINNVDNGQEVLTTLSRNNRQFNENNIRFSVGSNNQIHFNGVDVNIKTFNSLSNLQKTNFFNELPSIPMANLKHRNVITNSVNTYFNRSTLIESTMYIYKIYTQFSEDNVPKTLSLFSELVVDQLMHILRRFLEEAALDDFLDKNLLSLADDTVMKIIIDFFALMANASDCMSQIFGDRCDTYLKKMELVIMMASLDISAVTRKLLKFSITWLAQKAYCIEFNSEIDHDQTDPSNEGVLCEDCFGRHRTV